MCEERYATPMKDQKYASHRDILGELLIEYKAEDQLLNFEKRINL